MPWAGKLRESRALYLMAMIAIAAGGLFFRVRDLDSRSMHHDEANQAVRMGLLLEDGIYRYDPQEHHGPTLYYFTAAVARLTGVTKLQNVSESTLRAVPLAFGVALILMLLFVEDGLGRSGCLIAAVLTAVSPGMVYYSDFFIQEMLLVFFTFGTIACGWRYARSRRLGWAIAAGVCIGLMHATKETCVLAWAAMAGAFVLVNAPPMGTSGRDRLRQIRQALPSRKPLVLAGVTAAAVSVALFSSFFTHLRGPLDSVLTYFSYAGRTAAADNLHAHPSPLFYLHRLVAYKTAPGPVWTEGIIVVLAGFSLAGLLRRGREKDEERPVLQRFLGLYVIILTGLYSVIVYKTPWCALSILHGFILLAGAGAARLLDTKRPVAVRIGVLVLLCAGTLHLAKLTTLATGRYCADPRNPYAYVPTVRDLLRLPKRIAQLDTVKGDDKPLRIHVISDPHDYWPLPWYLRDQPSVGYWTEPCDAAVSGNPAIVITTPDFAADLKEDLGADYTMEYYGLRPNVLLAVLIRQDLWDRFLANTVTSSL